MQLCKGFCLLGIIISKKMETKEKKSAENQVVVLTETAIQQVDKLLERDGKARDSYGLRLAIKGGGCSGLSYELKFDEIKDKDLVQNFSAKESENPISVFIDPKSSIYLKGMTVDFDDGLMGKGFVFKNPNASNTCGCGESFSVF